MELDGCYNSAFSQRKLIPFSRIALNEQKSRRGKVRQGISIHISIFIRANGNMNLDSMRFFFHYSIIIIFYYAITTETIHEFWIPDYMQNFIIFTLLIGYNCVIKYLLWNVNFSKIIWKILFTSRYLSCEKSDLWKKSFLVILRLEIILAAVYYERKNIFFYEKN